MIFFTSIGPSIGNNVPHVDRNPTDYVTPLHPEIKFDIGSINPVHVIDLLKSMPSKNSTDIEGLSIKLLKHVSYQIHDPLSHIFNLSLLSGLFPEKFKLSHTVPVFKWK